MLVPTTSPFRSVVDMARSKRVIVLDGLPSLYRTFGAAVDGIMPAMEQALYAEAQNILADSRKEVPFLTGALSASGRVHDPYTANKTAMVEITYGGAAGGEVDVNYAILQHENTSFVHAEGRKSHYLEDPVLRAKEGMQDRLAKKINAVLRRRAEYEQWWQETEYGDS